MQERGALDPAEAPGQFLFIGLQGRQVTDSALGLLREVRPGGVILFRRNLDSLPGGAAFARAVRGAFHPAPLIAIDEEGGRVTRLAPHLEGLPSAHSSRAAGAASLREYWLRYGALLRALGVDVDFAPVVDLCPPDAANGIADRSYGTDPERTIQCARAAMEGLRESGVLPTLKHFPGLGATLLDSHHHLPAIRKGRDAFEQEDLRPFQALGGIAPAVMIGHGHYPFYSGPAPLAATLSREIATDLLRRRVGFRGVAVSDDLEMNAVAGRIDWAEIAPRALRAGNDMVLICHRADRILEARDAIAAGLRKDPAFWERCSEAAERIGELRRAAAVAAGDSPGPDPDRLETVRADLLSSAASLARPAA